MIRKDETSPDMIATQRPEVYLIRHAESELNTQRHFIGGRSNETPLTERGMEQARQVGRFLLGEDVAPTHVYVSPAVRTLQTAEYALAEMGIEQPPLIHDMIQELSQGEWEGRIRQDVYTDKQVAVINASGKDFKAPGGESMNDVSLRMHRFLAEIPPHTEIGPTEALVFTHGLAIRCLVGYLESWSHRQIFAAETPNTSVTKMTYEADGWVVDNDLRPALTDL